MTEIVQHVGKEDITVRIRMPRAYGLRMWLAAALVRLAGVIAPVTFEIEVEETPARS